MSFAGPAIFVDESGDPGLRATSRCRYFAIGFVFCDDCYTLRKRFRRLLKKLHLRNKYPPQLHELKFYLPETDLIQVGYMPKQLDHYRALLSEVRSKAINEMIKSNVKTFAAVVDKRKARQTWTAERLGNFVFAQTLIVNILNALSLPISPLIIYDKGRLTPSRARIFSQYLINKDSYFQTLGIKRYRGSIGIPNDVPSYSEPGIWAADIVAGAYHHKYELSDSSFADQLANIGMGVGERLYWP